MDYLELELFGPQNRKYVSEMANGVPAIFSCFDADNGGGVWSPTAVCKRIITQTTLFLGKTRT